MVQIDPALTEIAKQLQCASRITVLTGAGVSSASGVPTFRGKEGLWRSHSPQKLATPEAFEANPKLVWEWYDWRRTLISKCSPNAAHQTLAIWGNRYSGFTLITQNVDGLHEKAGSADVVNFHGSIWEVFCWNHCKNSPRRWIYEEVPIAQIPPCCPHCGGLIRPGVVWFGETIEEDVLQRSSAAVDCDVFMTTGTSALVYPAAGLVDAAHGRGAFTVEINLESTPASKGVDLSVRGGAEEIFPQIESILQTTQFGP
jgi:NAD-dependent deacetylase